MNLRPLFEIQREFDVRVIEEKGLVGQNLLPQEVLALLVELGELANEWRGFKFWTSDTSPRTKAMQTVVDPIRGTKVSSMNPMLEEYVDCLAFVLSIGLFINDEYDIRNAMYIGTTNNTLNQFNGLFRAITKLYWSIINEHFSVTRKDIRLDYEDVFKLLIGLGDLLGFTWEQIEQAYRAKNKECYARLERGY